jgi:hypothetical protein
MTMTMTMVVVVAVAVGVPGHAEATREAGRQAKRRVSGTRRSRSIGATKSCTGLLEQGLCFVQAPHVREQDGQVVHRHLATKACM